jgi:hypothetical protein
MSPIVVLAVVGAMAVAITMALTVLIIGIHRGDRHRLATAPRSHSDALARRILIGIRYPPPPAEPEPEPERKWPYA